ncbi:MAG: acyl-CoA thioesterase-1 [Aquiluna sp.]|jgi:acyl-CoA thioesterase-1|tara:strand:- start:2366 stop:2959 length:594 start_codon:yes stop_codon:yes gene_type:complete
MSDLRVVILGDELLTGAGDPKGIGWLGRVQARLPTNRDVAVFALPMIEETTSDLLARWKTEATIRFSKDSENYLVLALGSSDVRSGITISRSRLNLASLLDDAVREGIKVLVVGPTPTGVPEFDSEVKHLSEGFSDVVKRRQLTYVDCFSPLVDHEGWLSEVTNHPKQLPGQVGYGLIAWLVLNRGWFEWLGLAQAD